MLPDESKSILMFREIQFNKIIFCFKNIFQYKILKHLTDITFLDSNQIIPRYFSGK